MILYGIRIRGDRVTLECDVPVILSIPDARALGRQMLTAFEGEIGGICVLPSMRVLFVPAVDGRYVRLELSRQWWAEIASFLCVAQVDPGG